MADQLTRLKAINQQLKSEKNTIDPNVSSKVFSAVALAEEQIAFAVHLLEIRGRVENQQQARIEDVMITDGKSRGAGRDEQ